ncbi:MAG: hypothetical protein ACKE9I_00685, partial [Methylophagaceae bacterium]
NINVSIVNGIATITNTADWNGSESLTFTATDTGSLSVNQVVAFNVSAVDDIAIEPPRDPNIEESGLPEIETSQIDDNDTETEEIEKSDPSEVIQTVGDANNGDGDSQTLVPDLTSLDNSLLEKERSAESNDEAVANIKKQINVSYNQLDSTNVDFHTWEDGEYKIFETSLFKQGDAPYIDLNSSNTEGSDLLRENLKLMRAQMDADSDRLKQEDIEIEFVAGAALSLTAGAVTWVLRSGALLSSLLTSVTVFKQFDPLAVVYKKNNKNNEQKDDEDSKVEAMFDKESND